jgi:hypothetical protein
MTYKLFIDDERYPPNDGGTWVISRTSQEAIAAVLSLGMPAFISFDHDLGGEDTSMVFVNWLIDYMLDNHKDQFDFYVHSQNPVGKVNIEKRLLGLFTYLEQCND